VNILLINILSWWYPSLWGRKNTGVKNKREGAFFRELSAGFSYLGQLAWVLYYRSDRILSLYNIIVSVACCTGTVEIEVSGWCLIHGGGSRTCFQLGLIRGANFFRQKFRWSIFFARNLWPMIGKFVMMNTIKRHKTMIVSSIFPPRNLGVKLFPRKLSVNSGPRHLNNDRSLT